ncbi:MAG: signal peptidase II [Calditrichaceae bacterium]
MTQKRTFISISLILLISFDLISKNFAADFLKTREFIPVIGDILVFRYVENHSMAFNLLSSMETEVRFYTILAIKLSILLILIIIAMRKNSFSVLRLTAFTLIIAGGIGNFIDRAVNGYVIDFIHLFFSDTINFPVFNLADIFISTGIIILLFWGKPLTLFAKID